MMFIDKLSRLLLAPPARGPRATFYGLMLIAVPTVIRLLIDPVLGLRMPFFAYLPFIILAAALLDWKAAGGVALASWVVADLLFIAPKFKLNFGTIDIIGFMIFAASSVLIIAMVEAVRMIVDNSLRPARPGGFSTPVVFSLDRGQAWVSWHGSHSWVRLGPDDEVAEMMRDFLAQRKIAKRLIIESRAKLTGNP
jgi:hypothetical protein